MKSAWENTERRTLNRIAVYTPAIAVVRAKPTILLGQIQDISLGGLSFAYISNALQSNEASDLEILIPGGRYSVSGLSFATVSDEAVPKENPFTMITMRRRGVRFLHLTPLQTFRLRDLIQRVLSVRPDAPGLTTPMKLHERRTSNIEHRMSDIGCIRILGWITASAGRSIQPAGKTSGAATVVSQPCRF